MVALDGLLEAFDSIAKAFEDLGDTLGDMMGGLGLRRRILKEKINESRARRGLNDNNEEIQEMVEREWLWGQTFSIDFSFTISMFVELSIGASIVLWDDGGAGGI